MGTRLYFFIGICRLHLEMMWKLHCKIGTLTGQRLCKSRLKLPKKREQKKIARGKKQRLASKLLIFVSTIFCHLCFCFLCISDQEVFYFQYKFVYQIKNYLKDRWYMIFFTFLMTSKVIFLSNERSRDCFCPQQLSLHWDVTVISLTVKKALLQFLAIWCILCHNLHFILLCL